MDAQAGHRMRWDRSRGGPGWNDQPAIAHGAIGPGAIGSGAIAHAALHRHGRQGRRVLSPRNRNGGGDLEIRVRGRCLRAGDRRQRREHQAAATGQDRALAQPDLAWAASQGQLEGLPRKVAVRNLLGAHASYLHLVTRADRGVKAVEDLKGKRVSTGLAGGATDIKAIRVLGAHGVTPYNLGTHEQLDDAEAARALKDGRLDAFAIDAALPSRILRGLAAAGVPLRLIPTGEAVARIAERHGPFYFAASIPKGTYRGVEADISAAAAMTLFVAHEVMAESLAYEITKVLLERTPELAFADAAAREISSASAVRGSPVPFHPGALRYYKEAGIAVPQS
jgi:uncharacterized protein